MTAPSDVSAGRVNFYAIGTAPVTRDVHLDNLNAP